MLVEVRSRAKRRGLPFGLTRKWLSNILDDGRCQVTGIPFVFEGLRHPFSPSIDQVQPGKGYVHGNVRVVALIYNTAKSNWRHEDVVRMASALVATP